MSTPKRDRTADLAAHHTAARLQRAVLKLSFSFYGQNADLDERLKRLGAMVKAGRKDNGVQALIDEVVDVIVARGMAKGSNGVAAQMLAEVLERLPAEGEAADRSRALQRRLLATREHEELERLASEMGALVTSLVPPRRDEAEDAGGLPVASNALQTLLGRLRAPPPVGEELDAVRQRLDRARTQAALLECAEAAAAVLSAALAGTAGGPQEAPDLRAAKEQLARLLVTLDPPGSLTRESVKVRTLIEAATAPEQLVAAIQAFGGLLNGVKTQLEREVGSLGDFLRAVTRRLEHFRAAVTGSGEAHLQAAESVTAFQRTMNRQVSEMKGQVDEEEDLGRLKCFVIGQLEDLEAGLDGYAQGEQTRHTEAHGQLDAMLARLNDLENETQQLRADLDEQHALSLLDPLTGVFNRMGYNESMGREYARWQRQSGSLSIAVLDIDHFKATNDRFGHAAGDKVLASVASLIRRNIRTCDVLCRIGGEEFVVIMPDTPLDGALAVAQKLRTSIAASQFRFKDQPVPVTISVGVGAFNGPDTVEEVFERADRALYLAKRSGRNCCRSELDPPSPADAEPGLVSSATG